MWIYKHTVTKKVKMVPGPMVKMFGMFNRCGKSFEDATKKAEVIADNFWHHRALLNLSNPQNFISRFVFDDLTLLPLECLCY